VDEDHLIGIGVLIEIVCERMFRSRQRNAAIIVEEQRFSAVEKIVSVAP
jgi:hypothetical protein